MLFAAPFSGAVIKTSPDVRVRLQKNLKSVGLTGLGMQISSLSAGDGLEVAQIQMLPRGQWGVRFGKQEAWTIISGERSPRHRLRLHGQMLRLGVKPVPDQLELVRTSKKTFDLITRLPLEVYLSGVVPSEMPASWPIEALKAQAIAARSFAISMVRERRRQTFDVDSTIFDQVYKFAGPLSPNSEVDARVQQVLLATAGEVLTGPNRRVLKAFYSADCGCQSEDPKFVWGPLSAFESVKDPSCNGRPPSTWMINLSRTEVRSKLIAALELPEGANLRTLAVNGRTPSGRVKSVIAAVDVEGENKNVELKAQEFRRIFGFERIQSADFLLRWLADSLQIHGQGLGHGVGLCQFGARSLAEQGKSYREILKLYYPRAKLVKK